MPGSPRPGQLHRYSTTARIRRIIDAILLWFPVNVLFCGVSIVKEVHYPRLDYDCCVRTWQGCHTRVQNQGGIGLFKRHTAMRILCLTAQCIGPHYCACWWLLWWNHNVVLFRRPWSPINLGSIYMSVSKFRRGAMHHSDYELSRHHLNHTPRVDW